MVQRDFYSVTRQFDLWTMLVGTATLALLIAGMRLLRAPNALSGAVAGLVLTVALAQAVLFRGNDPRGASIAAGWAYAVFGVVTMVAVSGSPGNLPVIDHLTWTLGWALLFGGVVGYLAGALAAGVFLIADVLRGVLSTVQRAARSPRESTGAQSPWDDE